MKNKESSLTLNGNLTNSQWLALDTLSSILKGPLPLFSEDPRNHFYKERERSNLVKINLWKLMKERIHIESRLMEICLFKFKPIVRDNEDQGITTREVLFNIDLIIKHSIGLSCYMEPRLCLKIKMNLLADCGEWHVRVISFTPIDNQQYLIFRGFPTVYNIL